MNLPRVKVITGAIMDRALQQSSSSSSSSSSAVASFKTIVICQLSTASVSFVASLVMVFMILRTEKRLSTPYRRIIFGLGIADVVWALATLTGPLFLPSDTPSSWGLGSEGTCRASGFITHLFHGLVPMYTFFLSFYYLCKLKYKMTNEEFARRFEWKGHIFVNSFGIALSTVALALNTFHPGAFRTSCVLATTPLGCRMNPQIGGECNATIEKRVNAVTLVSQSLGVLWLIAMVVIMSTLYWHVIATNRMHSGGSASARANVDDGPIESMLPRGDFDDDSYSSEDSSEESMGLWSAAHQEGEDDDKEDPPTDILQQQQQQPALSQRGSHHSQSQPRTNLEYLSALYRKEIALQGAFYTLAYFMTHFPTILVYAILMTGNQPPKWAQVLPFVFAPLGGFFIMLVYTRPQIGYLRRNNPGLSRLKAFWLVLKAGGEVPEEEPIHERRGENLRRRRRGRRHGHGRGRGRHPMQQRGDGDESVSSMQFGARSHPPAYRHGQDVASSLLVIDGKSLSIQEGDLNYNAESKWSYVKGGDKNTAAAPPRTSNAGVDADADADADTPSGNSGEEQHSNDSQVPPPDIQSSV